MKGEKKKSTSRQEKKRYGLVRPRYKTTLKERRMPVKQEGKSKAKMRGVRTYGRDQAREPSKRETTGDWQRPSKRERRQENEKSAESRGFARR